MPPVCPSTPAAAGPLTAHKNPPMTRPMTPARPVTPRSRTGRPPPVREPATSRFGAPNDLPRGGPPNCHKPIAERAHRHHPEPPRAGVLRTVRRSLDVRIGWLTHGPLPRQPETVTTAVRWTLPGQQAWIDAPESSSPCPDTAWCRTATSTHPNRARAALLGSAVTHVTPVVPAVESVRARAAGRVHRRSAAVPVQPERGPPTVDLPMLSEPSP